LERDALERLRATVPPSTDAMVILGAQEGILLADDQIKSSLLLNNPVGRDLQGHLRRIGVMIRIHDLCKRGDLPFKSEITKMPIGGWHWLEIKAPGIRSHVCRTDYAEAFPEDTPNKQDARLVNPQGDLFKPRLAPLSEVLSAVAEMYCWLTYGATRDGKLTHLCWTVPAADQNSWLAHENILRGSSMNAPIPPPPGPDPKTKLRFRDYIEEALEKKDENEKA